MATDISVEVVFALAGEQRLLEVSLAPGSTVGDAIAASEMAKHFPDEDIDALQTGIWGRVVERDQQVQAGDRVELYRPLELDPREARRRLAALGKTMGPSGKR